MGIVMSSKMIAEKLEKTLRISTRPVGITLLKEEKDLPKEPLDQKINICQLVSMARYQGKANSGVPRMMICSMGAACTGLISTPYEISSGKAAVGLYANDITLGRILFYHTFKIGDSGKKYEGIFIEPLEYSKNDPDVVVVYGNAEQITRMIYASRYDDGEKVAVDTIAIASLCSCIGYAASQAKPIIGFPCVEERVFTGIQDYELIYVAPYGYVRNKLIKNLAQRTKESFSLYPSAHYVYRTPIMPSTCTIHSKDL
jgi:uncharacterized protein (DUF169 family)